MSINPGVFDEGCLPLGIANGIGDTARLNIEHFGGLHFIGVSSNVFQSAGDFTLTVECREVLAPESVCPDCQVGEIACEGSAAGVFPQSGCLRPESNGQEVDIYQVEVEEAPEETEDETEDDDLASSPLGSSNMPPPPLANAFAGSE